MRRDRAKYVTLVNGMRCSSCGTENAPDSRFCGGCGARLDGSRPRLAPTQKIADDASFPQPPRSLAPGAPGAPGVIPFARQPSSPPAVGPAGPGPTIAPAGVPLPAAPEFYSPPGRPPRAASELHAAPARDTPSFSMPIAARRPWPLITLVLLVDLGLAIAGIWLLSEGLGPRPAANRAAPARGASASP